MVNIPRISNIEYSSDKSAEKTAMQYEPMPQTAPASEIDEKKSSAAITSIAKAGMLIKKEIPKEYLNILKDFDEESKIHKLPLREKLVILQRLAIMNTETRNNAEWMYHSCSDMDYISEILNNPDKYNALVTYAKFIVDNDFLRQKSNKKLKNTLATKIAIMRYRDPQSWRNLVTSKGYKAITEGALRLDVIKNLEADTVVDENYFYNKFDECERNIIRSLTEMNVSDEFKEKFLKIADIDISKVPELLSSINGLDKELAVRLFDVVLDTKQKIDEAADKKYVSPSEYLDFFAGCPQLFELAKNNQEAAKQLLLLEGKDHIAITKILERVEKERKNPQITPFGTMIIPDFVKTSKINKDFSIPALCVLISKINEFLTPEYVQKNIAILQIVCAIFDNYVSETPPNVDLKTFLSYINKNNIRVFDYLVKQYPKNPEILKQQKQLLRYSYEIGDTGKEFFTSGAGIQEFAKLINKTANENRFREFNQTKAALKVLIDSPELYEKIKKNGVLKLISENKLSFETLDYLNKHSDFSTDVYNDIQKAIDNEPVVIEFPEKTNKTKVFKSTKTGDVVSIGRNLFINNGEKLEKWNITKEKYLELFPQVLRFASKQGQLGDCYFVSIIDNMMSKPKFRVKLYEMFSQDGDDIIVHLRGMDGYRYQNKVRFKNGDVEKFSHKRQLQGAKGLQMLEQAYAECAIREKKFDIISPDAPASVKINRLKTGSEYQVMIELLGLKPLSKAEFDLSDTEGLRGRAVSVDVKKSEESPDELLREAGQLANNTKAIVCFSMKTPDTNSPERTINNEYNLVSNHTYAIKHYDKEADVLYITNPWNCAIDIKVPVSLLAKYAGYINAGML